MWLKQQKEVILGYKKGGTIHAWASNLRAVFYLITSSGASEEASATQRKAERAR